MILMADLIKQRLSDALQPTLLVIENQSHLHQRHASSPQTGQSHFHITIQSPMLKGLPRVQQHQRIYQALGDAFEHGLHAVSIDVSK